MKVSGERRPRIGGKPDQVPAPVVSWAYFFDIDGTLVDIAPSPAEIVLERELQSLIRELHEATGGALALISGRAISDVDSIFGDVNLPVAGQHGLERRGGTGKITRHHIVSEKLDFARERIAQAIATHPELLFEDKGLSLALHYRSAPKLASYAHRTMRSVAAAMGEEYALQSGKRVVELKPSGKDKGDAVREFMHEAPFKGRTPVFVGDDVTDEHGFAVVNSLDGHSIKVGGGPTSAAWRLPNVRAVRSWLERREP
ncbi:MAG TPA: trehalose-phosphatase [Gemmatimonadaceae bacterium]